MKFTRRFAFGADITVLRELLPTGCTVVGIITNAIGERVVGYSGHTVEMAIAYMEGEKESTVYMMHEVGWVLVEVEGDRAATSDTAPDATKQKGE